MMELLTNYNAPLLQIGNHSNKMTTQDNPSPLLDTGETFTGHNGDKPDTLQSPLDTTTRPMLNILNDIEQKNTTCLHHDIPLEHLKEDL